MKKSVTNFCLFCFGYSAYSIIELAYRRYTHFSMGIAGGICFLAIYHIYKKYPKLTLFKKCVIGSLLITTVEFCFGVLFNIILKLDIWDYSTLPFNILGQVCPLFSLAWMLLCIPINSITKRIIRLEKSM